MSRSIISKIDKRQSLKYKNDGRFAIISWNTANRMLHLGNDEYIVNIIINEIKGYKANVICLQELLGSSFYLLNKRLKEIDKSWSCFFDWKEKGRGDKGYRNWRNRLGLAICVLGRGSNFKLNYFTLDGKPWRDEARRYIQIDYMGVRITCVHTNAGDLANQIPELHKKVTSGIIAGDFNYPWPDKPSPNKWWTYDPGWYQTDLSREWTHPQKGKPKKIDHILAIDKPQAVGGRARNKWGSDHRLILGGIMFTEKDEKTVITLPVTKKPIPLKPIRKISPKKTTIAKRKTTIAKRKTTIAKRKTTIAKRKTAKKFVTKKKSSKSIVSRKILRKKTR